MRSKGKRILFITEDFPSGLNGTSVKTRSTLEYLLKQKYVIDLCCLHFDDFKLHSLDHKNLTVHVQKTHRVNKRSLNFFKYVAELLIAPIPISIKRLFNTKLAEKIFDLMQNNQYKHIFFDGYSTLQYLNPALKDKSIYIDDEDFTDLYLQRFLVERRILHKLFYFFEFLKSLLYEKNTLTKVSQVWAISPRTQKRLQNVSHKPTVLMPTLIYLKRYLYSGAGKQLVFTGTLNWRENVEGLKWFVEHHWEKILGKIPDATLVVVGQGATTELQTFLSKYKNIYYRGYVKSLETEYARSVLSIAPVRINAGIKVKILTYMSYGLPVVSTQKAAWGLVSTSGVEIAADDTFATVVVGLLNDDKKMRRLSKLAHDNIKKNYSVEVLHTFFTKNLK